MSRTHKPLAVAIGAALAASFGAASAGDASPFSMTALGSGYMAADAGEGNCGGGKGGAKGKFEAMDADGDGELTRQEHTAHWNDMFDELDENRDDQITRSEMEAAHKAHAEGSCGGDKGAEGSCGGDKGERKSEMFTTMDTNGDAGVSRAELAAFAEARFDSIDSDGDGSISADDMEEAHDDMEEMDDEDM
ncbi:MAG: EF-hand domain-containing protein [Gammaproteobacteria bacterium]